MFGWVAPTPHSSNRHPIPVTDTVYDTRMFKAFLGLIHCLRHRRLLTDRLGVWWLFSSYAEGENHTD
jgi:hypothetical protein